METNRVYIVQNGEGDWTRMNVFCGWHDVDISDSGIYDMVLTTVAELLKENIKFDVAYTSILKRAMKSLEIIMNSLHLPNIKMNAAWQLNSRHFGALTGFNKQQMADIYGEEQVLEWRRSFDTLPPPMQPTHAYYNQIKSNPKFQSIPEDKFPTSESLQTSMQRVIPYWEDCIVPEIKNKKTILIVAHDTTIRALVQYIENLTPEQILKFRVPYAVPFSYEFDIKTMKKIGDIKYHADDNIVEKAKRKYLRN